MKNATLLKIASLFIFLLSAQFSFGQTILTNDDFSQDAGTWTSGGNYATLYDLDDIGEYSLSYSCTNLSDNVFLLRNDNGAASSIISQTYDLSGYDSVAFEYDYAVFEMNNPGDEWLLEFSDNNGATWQTAKHYYRTLDYYNDDCGVWGSNSKEVVTLQSSDYTFNSTNKFRLRAQDVPGNNNSRGFLFVDNIVVAGYANISLNDVFHEDFEDNTSSGNANDFSGNDEINNIPWIAVKQGSANKWRISGGKWEGKRVLSASSLTTDPFSISGYQALQFEFDVEFKKLSTSQVNKLRVFYTIDSGPEQLLAQYIARNTNQIYTVNLPSTTTGDNITLRIEMRHHGNPNNSNAEYKIDYIKLRGYNPNGPQYVFFEDFSGYPNNSDDVDTITGSGTSTTNPNGVSWSLTGPESANEIKLHHDGGQGDNGHIHTKKVNGTATFETDPITVSGYTGLNLKIYVDKLENLDNNDTIELGYDIDGLGYTVIETITGYGDFTVNGNKVEDVTIDSDIIAIGDSIVIYIKITHPNNSDGKFEWDDIKLTGTPFYNVWQGTNVDLVTDTAKWSKGSQPTEASNVWIPNTKHLKLINDQAYNTVNARATSQLTIEKTGSLTTVGDFTKIAGTGAVTLNSDSNEFASIVVGGTATGDVTYNKYVNITGAQGEAWDLVGSPVLEQDMASFADINIDNSYGPLAYDGNQYAIGPYLADQGYFENYTGVLFENTIISTGGSIENAGDFPAAKGFQMATFWGATMAFTGKIASTEQIITIQNHEQASGSKWNLIANPFPSYIKGNELADGGVGNINNFISQNGENFTQDFVGIYGWRADGSGYDAYNLANLSEEGIPQALILAPGQGFMVAARYDTEKEIKFTPQMRTVTGGDDFISGAPMLLNHFLKLKLYHGNSEKENTKFFFQQGLTLGLDQGYDAGAYNQAAALSSRLPEDDQGVNFQINAMSIETAYNQSIPLVIKQQQGQNFRISISNNTLPEDVNVYLEDTQNGTLTSLKDQDFELIAQEDLSDAGRFYIRFTTQNLAVNDVLSPSSITVFKLNTDNFITIKGLSPEMGKTTATLYNMLGMKVREKTLNNTAATQQISTQGLASGVYIINLKAGEQAISKKVIIQ